MKAVVFGPGRIGCGFVGEVLAAAGFHITFVGRDPAVVSHLRHTGSYRIRLTSPGDVRPVTVVGVSALPHTQTREVAAAVAEADLVATAVGPSNLGAVAPLIAVGLRQRQGPVNVIAFENLLDPGAELRRLVAASMSDPTALLGHGFAGGLVHRAVTHRVLRQAPQPSLELVADPVSGVDVDRLGLCSPLPVLPGVSVCDNFGVLVQRKLYTYSAGHATTAYLGYLKGYHYIHTAIRDPEIRREVSEVMREGQRGLATRYGQELAGGPEQIEQILGRFENPGLADPIARVGRDPARKLAAHDRLVGAARLAGQAGIPAQHLALAAAAALCFSNPSDLGSGELLRKIEASGLGPSLRSVCGLNPRRGFGKQVHARWSELRQGWLPGNLLLSLDQLLWARSDSNMIV